MSQFTNFKHIKIPTDNSGLFELWEDLIYERYYEGSWLYIVAPSGFKTNFASLPIIVQLFWKPYDPRWIKSSILHDELWSRAKTLREFQDANDVFYEAMQVEGTPRWIATLFYLAVSLSKYAYWIAKKFYNPEKTI